MVLLVPGLWLLSRWGGIDVAWYAAWISEAAALVFAAGSLKGQLRKKVAPLDALRREPTGH